MPQDFNQCVAQGGRVITKKIGALKYVHICYPQSGGRPIAGEVKTKKVKKPQ